MYDQNPTRYPWFADVECEGGIGPLDAYDSDFENENIDLLTREFTFDLVDDMVSMSASTGSWKELQPDITVWAGDSFGIFFTNAVEFTWRKDPTCSYIWEDENDSANNQRLYLYFTAYHQCLGNDMLTATGYISVQEESDPENDGFNHWIAL